MIHNTTLEPSDRSASRPPTNALVDASLKASPGANRQPGARTQLTDQRIRRCIFESGLGGTVSRASERNQQTNALVAAPLKATPLGTIDARNSGS
jgi:hypothetical protein